MKFDIGSSRVILTTLILVAALSAAAHGELITLGVGEAVFIGDDCLVVGFDEVLADSRCPTGACCFWEGDANARIWALLPSHEKQAFELHTHRSFPWMAQYASYRIWLLGVAPYPTIQRPIDPKDYRVTLEISDTRMTVQPATWSMIKRLYDQ